MRKKKDMVELNLRLPSDGWKDLTALLLALLGGAPAASDNVQRSGGENAAFDEMAFRRLSGMEPEMISVQSAETAMEEQSAPRYRVEGSVDAPLSVPAPADYGGMEGAEGVSGRRETGDWRDSAEQKVEAEDWERRWERDCRRYDSGFPLR